MAGYRTVCEAKTKAEMLAAFDTVLNEVVAENGGTREGHRQTQLSNVGYFAGYYDAETYKRVHEWLGTEHPIFGRSYPAPQEAMKAGKQASQS